MNGKLDMGKKQIGGLKFMATETIQNETQRGK